MNLDTISAVSEAIAAIAVVASLIYLAIQVRDSKNSTLSATHYQVTESIYSVLFAIAENPELSRIYLQGNADPSKLASDELPRYMILVGGIFSKYNNYFLQHENGTLPEEPWEIAIAHMRTLMNLPGVQLWWKNSRQFYLVGMQELLDEALEKCLRSSDQRGSNVST